MRLSWQEVAYRAEQLSEHLVRCDLCPRQCHVNRLKGETGICRTGSKVVVSSAFPHFGEEDVLVGKGGSGTIFFSECNLRCIFCQNYTISHGGEGYEMEPEELANVMLSLARMGCSNINLVTPTHVLPQILSALAIARREGLEIPIVYNTSAYDSVDTLKMLDGVVDIYMPDFKTMDEKRARTWFNAADYPSVALAAIREMHRQVKDLELNDSGMAIRGLLVRHLVMPDATEDARNVFMAIAAISRDTFVNVMGQYRPMFQASLGINRRPTIDEVMKAREAAVFAGLWRFA